jgi:hypothetical protein
VPNLFFILVAVHDVTAAVQFNPGADFIILTTIPQGSYDTPKAS